MTDKHGDAARKWLYGILGKVHVWWVRVNRVPREVTRAMPEWLQAPRMLPVGLSEGLHSK